MMEEPFLTPESLPFITPELAGCGGVIKARPADFVVEEVPLYEPCGDGPHLYINLTREGWTTRQVIEALADMFGLKPADVGYAGLKDRHARCTQTFSLPGLTPPAAERIAHELPFQVHWARQHTNKLKPGHLLGNRFRIVVSELTASADEATARSRAIANRLAMHGVPNFFGAQRFGIDYGNIARGHSILLGAWERDKWRRKLYLSAYQSHLFNRYLSRRVALNLFHRLLPGDIAKKAGTGGMFEVTDVEAEQPRYDRGEIHFTGPMVGAKMWAAKGLAGELEEAVLGETGIAAEHYRQAHLDGTRRAGRVWLPDIDATADAGELHLSFFLPKGAYATVVVREFTKSETGSPEIAVGDEEDL